MKHPAQIADALRDLRVIHYHDGQQRRTAEKLLLELVEGLAPDPSVAPPAAAAVRRAVAEYRRLALTWGGTYE
jgi:hypothetical protein